MRIPCTYASRNKSHCRVGGGLNNLLLSMILQGALPTQTLSFHQETETGVAHCIVLGAGSTMKSAHGEVRV